MELGYDRDLYLLAFDHRGSFAKGLFGVAGTPSAEDADRISDAKAVIFEGYLESLSRGVPREAAGLLVDEEFGAEIARKATADGAILAMPVEKSGQDEFDFEYGHEFGAHVEAFEPAFAKALVRYNPEGDRVMNERQAARLRALSDWLHATSRRFLFELLVPPTPDQLAAVDDDADRYDIEMRPNLVIGAIEELQAAGVEPDVWKIEGLDRREDCARVADAARAGGRDGVACIVLGRGADDAKVESWLRAGSGVPGFRGFAIGRTLWWDALEAYRDVAIDRREAADRIASKYLWAIDVYRGA
jgi:myo-inositol catabolism protein IolC